MKTTLTFTIYCLFSLLMLSGLNGQSYHTKRLFKKGDSDIMAGFGLFPTFIKDRTDQVLPPVSLRYENRISNNFSMSLELGHSISNTVKKDVFSDEREYRNEYYFLALRNSAHCNCENFSNWDIYGGFALGLNLTNITVINGTFGPSEKLYGISPKNTQMTFNGFVGARYVCTKKLSFFGEFGYGASLLQLGMGYKL